VTTAAVIEFIVGLLCENPRKVGLPLLHELAGLWSARRGAYRVVYEIDDEATTVTILRVEHRSDVYRPVRRSELPQGDVTADPARWPAR